MPASSAGRGRGDSPHPPPSPAATLSEVWVSVQANGVATSTISGHHATVIWPLNLPAERLDDGAVSLRTYRSACAKTISSAATERGGAADSSASNHRREPVEGPTDPLPEPRIRPVDMPPRPMFTSARRSLVSWAQRFSLTVTAGLSRPRWSAPPQLRWLPSRVGRRRRAPASGPRPRSAARIGADAATASAQPRPEQSTTPRPTSACSAATAASRTLRSSGGVERDRAGRGFAAHQQILAPGSQRGGQRVADRGEFGELGVDLGQLHGHPRS